MTNATRDNVTRVTESRVTSEVTDVTRPRIWTSGQCFFTGMPLYSAITSPFCDPAFLIEVKKGVAFVFRVQGEFQASEVGATMSVTRSKNLLLPLQIYLESTLGTDSCAPCHL